MDNSGQPVDEITVELETNTPPIPEDYFLIEAFDFGPDGATFSPAMEITIEYDLSQLPAGQEPVIAYYSETAGEWVVIPGTVDTDAGTITFSVEHFTVFIVMSDLAQPGEDVGINWWIWLVIGFVALLVIFLLVWLLIQRRAAPAQVVSDDFNRHDDSF